MAFVMHSSAFQNGHRIPRRYTCEGENLSPPLEWSDTPQGTRSFVLIVDDPDAPKGTFRHWGMYNIPASWHALPEGHGADGAAKDMGTSINDFGRQSYDGPMPPKGHGMHHYHFHLVALDTPNLDVPPNAKVRDIWEAARPHILAEAELVGLYERH